MYLVWFDGDKRKAAATKVVEGATRYREKFGKEPAHCLCHPSDIPPGAVVGFPIIGRSDIGRYQFWIGESE